MHGASAAASLDTRNARSRWARRLVASAVGVALLVVAGGSPAEIYRWKDAQGRLHFAQSLQQVPAAYRSQARANAERSDSGPSRVQTYQPSRSPAAKRAPSAALASGAGTVHRIPVQRAGTSLRVMVRLNDQLDRLFILDTGATDVVVPRAWIEELGIDTSAARTGKYKTANGIVESAKIRLDSVTLGSARARDVPASVSDSMSIGLLGLSFLNHFKHQVDPARGIVTLVENGMADDGRIRGGRSEAQWRSEFLQLEARREQVERERSIPRSHRGQQRLEAELEELERQLELLEDEADEARVPFRWRE